MKWGGAGQTARSFKGRAYSDRAGEKEWNEIMDIPLSTGTGGGKEASETGKHGQRLGGKDKKRATESTFTLKKCGLKPNQSISKNNKERVL